MIHSQCSNRTSKDPRYIEIKRKDKVAAKKLLRFASGIKRKKAERFAVGTCSVVPPISGVQPAARAILRNGRFAKNSRHDSALCPSETNIPFYGTAEFPLLDRRWLVIPGISLS